METTKTLTFAKAQMLIRKPPREVFDAFVDPTITSKFWFTNSTGRLETGKKVRWTWALYNVGTDVHVVTLEQDRRIVFKWGDPEDLSIVEMLFTETPSGTFLRVSESGRAVAGEALLKKAIDQTGGWNLVLAALKAQLELGVILKVVADHHPPEAE
jgi:uncharacterized protein YndB with AHSA1/START domain